MTTLQIVLFFSSRLYRNKVDYDNNSAYYDNNKYNHSQHNAPNHAEKDFHDNKANRKLQNVNGAFDRVRYGICYRLSWIKFTLLSRRRIISTSHKLH